MTIIQDIVFINGIYDVLCAASIKQLIDIPTLNNLHLSMYHNPQNVNKTLLALWIFANGIIRCSIMLVRIPPAPLLRGASLFTNKSIAVVVALSYYIEAIYFAGELILGNVIMDKAMFVIITSIILGYCVMVEQ
jgi:hypothetical protein